MSNYYEILRVSPSAPVEVIHAAYRTLMKTLRMHPDLGGDTTEAMRINEAYDVLKDSQKRKQYDRTLAQNLTPEKRKRGEERRRFVRRDVNATISYCLDHDGRWYPARVKDVSEGGLRLMAREPLGKGAKVVIACSNPTAPALRGQIRWSRMFHPSIFERVFEVGVEFESPVKDVEQRFTM